MFLQLLVAQLQNQDPTAPVDPSQFVGQLAQFSELSEVTSIYTLLQSEVPAATGSGSGTSTGGNSSGATGSTASIAAAAANSALAALSPTGASSAGTAISGFASPSISSITRALSGAIPNTITNAISGKIQGAFSMPDFSIPLSGLTAESTDLSAIANNLANQNTTGYKATSALFSDLFYQNLGTTGSGDPIQLGAGTEISSNDPIFSQGSVSATGVPTDVAIQGNGFFEVQSPAGVISYTRAGDFTTDQNNFLVTSAGQQVLGYPAVNGVVNTGAGVVPLQLGAGTISPPAATANTELTTNLDAAGGVGSTYSTPVTIYDSLGASHTLTYNFTNIAPNTWSYSLNLPPADLNPVNGVAQTGVLASGTLIFNGNGQLAATGGGVGTPTYASGNTGNGTISGLSTTAAAVVPQVITLTATSATQFTVTGSASGALGTATVGTPFTSGQINFTLAAGSTAFAAGDKITIPTIPFTLNNLTAIPITGFADGASNQTFNWNVMNGTTPVITQDASPSTTTGIQQDGSSSGSLANFSIGADGTITGTFSNDKTQALGQIALANFANVNGLQLQGLTDFSPTLASGPAVIGVPGEGVLGTLSGGSLELSNVDIATEFANLIVAQRGFEADAKAVTTFDQITQDTIALKQ
jgi:flagellar hook protein FlgE